MTTERTEIDEAIASLDSLEDVPVADHPATFEAIHRVLRDQLAGRPGTPE